MNTAKTFKQYCSAIHLWSTDSYDDTFGTIQKTLDCHYYDGESSENHLLYVGSVGRGTAVDGTSDVDLLYILPPEEKSRFDSYKGNGQSALLQDVKSILDKRYPQTVIKGDGQAVVIDFSSKHYTIDLVPAFRCNNGPFDYPDTNDGGRWRTTNPIPEQAACKHNSECSRNGFAFFCNILREWKNEQGFLFSGLLIDTLVDHFFQDNPEVWSATFGDYPAFLQSLFAALSGENPSQSYWLALGSNQQIVDKGKGRFVAAAKRGNALLAEVKTPEDLEKALVNLLGKQFSECMIESVQKERTSSWSKRYKVNDTEEFVSDQYPVNIQYSLDIDCTVTQNGFQPRSLHGMLLRHFPLLKMSSLDFHITNTNVPKPYEVFWKVRNCGEEAYRRNCIRGQICKDNGNGHKTESTDFIGPHYVECYLIKKGCCVARDRIDVPIE